MNDGDRTNEASTDEMVDWYFPKNPGARYPSPDEVGDPDKRRGLPLIVQKLNLLTVFSALVLFFLPWLDIRCSQSSLATQTGIQIIYGGGTTAAAASNETATEKTEDEVKAGPLMAVAFLAVVIALITAAISLISRRELRRNWTGIFSSVALGILLVQIMVGFPVERAIEKDKARMIMEEKAGSSSDPFSGLALAIADDIKVRYLPAFYAVLALLGFPTLVSLNAWIDRLRSRAG